MPSSERPWHCPFATRPTRDNQDTGDDVKLGTSPAVEPALLPLHSDDEGDNASKLRPCSIPLVFEQGVGIGRPPILTRIRSHAITLSARPRRLRAHEKDVKRV